MPTSIAFWGQEDWHNAGSSSIWTTAVKSVVVKWDGVN